ncbi:hypothetical protein M413DRAFT_440754, partial [Hebeloma cylindrosporum]
MPDFPEKSLSTSSVVPVCRKQAALRQAGFRIFPRDHCLKRVSQQSYSWAWMN